jgi:hypothetical protein
MRQTTFGAADLSAPGDLASNAASFARYLRAANVTLATSRPARRHDLGRFLPQRGMSTDVATISARRFISDQPPAGTTSRLQIHATSR